MRALVAFLVLLLAGPAVATEQAAAESENKTTRWLIKLPDGEEVIWTNVPLDWKEEDVARSAQKKDWYLEAAEGVSMKTCMEVREIYRFMTQGNPADVKAIEKSRMATRVLPKWALEVLDRNLKEADKWLGGSTPDSTYRQCRKVKPPVTVKYNVDKHEAEEARREAERKKQRVEDAKQRVEDAKRRVRIAAIRKKVEDTHKDCADYRRRRQTSSSFNLVSHRYDCSQAIDRALKRAGLE